jgi:type II secretory pathway pseudopilin PulG
MIVVAIIGILLGIAIPNFKEHTETARAKACQANLRQIKNAASLWALENKKALTDSVDVNALADFFEDKKIPICPAGGSYGAPFTPATAPTCSTGGKHKLD